jgi:hypothetical protein
MPELFRLSGSYGRMTEKEGKSREMDVIGVILVSTSQNYLSHSGK